MLCYLINCNYFHENKELLYYLVYFKNFSDNFENIFLYKRLFLGKILHIPHIFARNLRKPKLITRIV